MALYLFLFVYLSNYVTDVSTATHLKQYISTSANEPVSNEPISNKPVSNEPVSNKPVASEPVSKDDLICTDNEEIQKFRSDFLWAQAYSCYYKLHDFATDWLQAKQSCEAQRATLLVVETLEEMENLKILMSNMKAYYAAIFVGIHDRFAEGMFVKVTGEPIARTVLELLWAEGRPDNINNSEHCVVMTREGLLDDRPCTSLYPFICKIFLNQTHYNEACDMYDPGYSVHDKVSGKCYKFHEEPLTWHDAYLICSLEQGHLAIINSAQEANVVANLLSEYLSNRLPDPDLLYLGFSDLMFPYQYRTIKGETLQQAGYYSWAADTDKLTPHKTKRCGAMSRNGYLTVTHCDVPSMFLCEKVLNFTK